MTSPLELPPEVESITRSVTVRTRGVPAVGQVRVGAELFLPREDQVRFLRALLEQEAEDLDVERAAVSAGVASMLPRWRLEPGFVKWVEEHLDASARLDMAVLRRKVMRAAIRELDCVDPEQKPRALPLVAKLWPAAKLGKQGDEGTRVTVSATELFKKLRAPSQEPSAETEVTDGD